MGLKLFNKKEYCEIKENVAHHYPVILVATAVAVQQRLLTLKQSCAVPLKRQLMSVSVGRGLRNDQKLNIARLFSKLVYNLQQ